MFSARKFSSLRMGWLDANAKDANIATANLLLPWEKNYYTVFFYQCQNVRRIGKTFKISSPAPSICPTKVLITSPLIRMGTWTIIHFFDGQADGAIDDVKHAGG